MIICHSTPTEHCRLCPIVPLLAPPRPPPTLQICKRSPCRYHSSCPVYGRDDGAKNGRMRRGRLRAQPPMWLPPHQYSPGRVGFRRIRSPAQGAHGSPMDSNLDTDALGRPSGHFPTGVVAIAAHVEWVRKAGGQHLDTVSWNRRCVVHGAEHLEAMDENSRVCRCSASRASARPMTPPCGHPAAKIRLGRGSPVWKRCPAKRVRSSSVERRTRYPVERTAEQCGSKLNCPAGDSHHPAAVSCGSARSRVDACRVARSSHALSELR